MKKKISIQQNSSIKDYFEDFLRAKKASGLALKTIQTYRNHFNAISYHLDTSANIFELKKSDLEQMISSMRDAELAANSIKSYTRTLRSFFSWCKAEHICDFYIPLYKAEETIKDTYTDDELIRLLRKPNMRSCSFVEYRNWVIINLLINNGIRAASIRNIKNDDVRLEDRIIRLSHTKNKRTQVIPLSETLCAILREYKRIRKGSETDYLFPTETEEQLSENGLRSSIAKYNRKRGVAKTSIHMFRHTFAKKYLLDCHGNALTLQHLLGHSTLDMTKHYCAIFDADIVKDFDQYSPLEQLKSNKRITMR